MKYTLASIDPNQFLQLWSRYEKLGVPDPTQTAINEMMHPIRPEILPPTRMQLENLVAYWRTHAKPGRVLYACKSYHYVHTLRNWRPTGAIQ